jgi:hypothetical protein
MRGARVCVSRKHAEGGGLVLSDELSTRAAPSVHRLGRLLARHRYRSPGPGLAHA